MSAPSGPRVRADLHDAERVLCMITASRAGHRPDGALIRPGALVATTERLIHVPPASARHSPGFAAAWAQVDGVGLLLSPVARLAVTVDGSVVRFFVAGEAVRWCRIAQDRRAILDRERRPALRPSVARRRLHELRERLDTGALDPARYEAERASVLARS